MGWPFLRTNNKNKVGKKGKVLNPGLVKLSPTFLKRKFKKPRKYPTQVKRKINKEHPLTKEAN